MRLRAQTDFALPRMVTVRWPAPSHRHIAKPASGQQPRGDIVTILATFGWYVSDLRENALKPSNATPHSEYSSKL